MLKNSDKMPILPGLSKVSQKPIDENEIGTPPIEVPYVNNNNFNEKRFGIFRRK